jgi:hypothetical protein
MLTTPALLADYFLTNQLKKAGISCSTNEVQITTLPRLSGLTNYCGSAAEQGFHNKLLSFLNPSFFGA